MARTTRTRYIATPESTDQELQGIAKQFEARIYRIKSDYPIVREKLASQLAHMRKKDNKADTLDIKHGLIVLFDAIYDSYQVPELRIPLINELDKLLASLRRHRMHDGYARHMRHAFTFYFHRLLRKKENLTEGFFPWFESYTIKWQDKHVFGEAFDFNKWKVVTKDHEQKNTCMLQYHFGLLKAASIQMLEGYLTGTCLGFDRINNAEWLLSRIRNLEETPASFLELQDLLNKAKKTALSWDAEIDKDRFSFFRRHRFGSRYITLLDDLRERALFCQNDEVRAAFKEGEESDRIELTSQHAARMDDDHATRYLAKQVHKKEELIAKAFKI